MSGSAVANNVEQRTFVAHLANMTSAHDVKLADVRHLVVVVLKAMFSLNAADFSALIRALPAREADVVRAMIEVPTTVARPRQLDVTDKLRETTKEIANYNFGAPTNGGGSRDSGIVDATSYARNVSARPTINRNQSIDTSERRHIGGRRVHHVRRRGRAEGDDRGDDGAALLGELLANQTINRICRRRRRWRRK